MTEAQALISITRAFPGTTIIPKKEWLYDKTIRDAHLRAQAAVRASIRTANQRAAHPQ